MMSGWSTPASSVASPALRLHPEVETALAEGRPVVALESTIFSRLGLPSPAGAEALARCLAAVEKHGALPAVTAVLDGVARVGVDPGELEAVILAERKVAARDLSLALAQRWPAGATTVSASLALAARAGIAVFTTGAIGGVHRGAEISGDISGDLEALARFPVITVCTGAKAFLDVGATLERLETLGVPVLGLGTDRFPGFWYRDSGFPVLPVASPAEAAGVAVAGRRLGYEGGFLLAVPVPPEAELPREAVEGAIEVALGEAAAVSGPEVTPYVLGRIADLTGGRSVAANVAAAEHNAEVAAAVAGALAGQPA
jgi:pseudouridine-5'-phosphate glycosidase